MGYDWSMKVAPHSKTAGRGNSRVFNSHSRTYTLSVAKTYLGRLVEKAVKGETVYIVSGSRKFILQHLPQIEPIPMRPEGYFAACYSREEIELENKLGKFSVIEKPKDLE
jgi:hypothetical protein